MRRSLKTGWLIRKNRFRRAFGSHFRDYCRAFALFFAVFSLTGALIYGYCYVVSSPYFEIKGMVVRGCKELTEKDVVALAGIKPSQTIFSVNIRAMARRISANPWIKSVAVGREFPNRIVVEVQERTPLALYRTNKGFFLLDKDGTPFKKLAAEDDVDLPVMTGFGEETDRALFNKTLVLLKGFAESKSFPTLNSVAEVHASNAAGLSVITDNGFCLKLGFDNYEEKLRRLLPIITVLNKKNIKQELLNIDLRDTHNIFVERRGAPEPPERVEEKEGFRT